MSESKATGSEQTKFLVLKREAIRKVTVRTGVRTGTSTSLSASVSKSTGVSITGPTGNCGCIGISRDV